MERIDRKILEDLQHVTQEERKGVMKAYDIEMSEINQYLIWGETGYLTCSNCGAEHTGEVE